ncbi:GNAT family N-acetyltransferase [Brevibacillus fluminis]|uniref:GNAT family N-acetyltransferase n=1 Tax=Brevibacillus fluminis TaxID=511487 RepID=UPI003F8C51A4
MRTIRELGPTEVDAFVGLAVNAYPGMNSFSEQARGDLKKRIATSMEEDAICRFYGLFEDEQMIGGMKFFDFDLTLLTVPVQAGGIGFVCVDLLHKKEKVAKEMLTYYLQHYLERGVNMAMLYPFRVDFYKQMGFGPGTKMHQYRFLPTSLPKTGDKSRCSFLKADDLPEMVELYNRQAAKTNGMIQRTTYEQRGTFASPETIAVGYREDGKLTGYLTFLFKRGHEENFIFNHLVVKELFAETPEAYTGLIAFLRSQADQVQRIIYNTQDDTFHQLLSDPRNESGRMLPSVYHESHVSGVGIMYRVLDVKGIFRDLAGHDFGGQTCTVKITVQDSFLPENHGSTIVAFNNGAATVSEQDAHDVEIELDISDFSSLLVGAVPFRQLMRYGLVRVSDSAYVETLGKLFGACEKPLCTTPF